MVSQAIRRPNARKIGNRRKECFFRLSRPVCALRVHTQDVLPGKYVQADYSDIISQPDGSRYITATTVKSFRRYVLTQRVFDHQDWSPMYYCRVSRPNCATRARTLFRKGVYVKGDSVPMKRIF